MAGNLRAIVIGCGNMGASHARAYAALDGFELVGLVARSPTRRGKLAAELAPAAEFDTLEA
ncbi:MAG TPA: gfo/Idh/MocA family oxidoreductase, partial [Candidatus Sumerlaeota bacterium]|nr:gfo/Idh/MocA family oxidoreductase [Candidatus Sumerlaeota bacterium]